MSHINASGTSGASSGANPSNHGDSRGHPGECSYKEFTNAKPKSFDDTGGVIALTRWFEKTESIFKIYACPESSKVKFAACTFTDRALTWWNNQVKSLTLPIANSMSWNDLKELMQAEYYPGGKMQKLEQELWNMKMKDSDITAYTARFSDLALLCPGMVTPESKKVESAKRLAQTLVDHGGHQDSTTTITGQPKESGSKKKFWNKRKGQSSQEPSTKEQIVVVHAAIIPAVVPNAPTPPSRYVGYLPKCDKCNFHYHRPCREMQCNNCNKKGTQPVCKTLKQPTNQTPGAGVGQACYGCSETGHYKRDCLKARNGGNTGRVLTMGQEEAVVDPTVVTGTLLLDNSYACIIFESGVERNFISHKFKHLLKQKPQPLNETFTVEMDNGNKDSTNNIFLGCTLTLNDYSIPINLMSVSIKSFNFIISMDWLKLHRADILCYKKGVCLNLPTGETLVIYGDKPSTNLSIISCIKAQK
ncbi:uncharacterized protein LOC111896416 [Lactuca sativa]|uniref:uncharacterized protein LOC111896416 n=1 Tax=Lactuca sativa TaxID=4236 RepID=UPI000CD9114E|nr:uncharacterized protein LOC111896416 [Lactuca sativa]